jgi:transposase InsO family protein
MKKRILASIAAAAFLSWLATPGAVEAKSDPRTEQAAHGHYHVYYRADEHHPWKLYGTYRSHGEAHGVAQHLREQGCQARVSHNR